MLRARLRVESVRRRAWSAPIDRRKVLRYKNLCSFSRTLARGPRQAARRRLGAWWAALLVAASVLPLAAGAPEHSQDGRKAGDPVERLESWIHSLERGRGEPTPRDEQLLQQLCADARLLCAAYPERSVEVARVFLLLACAQPAPAAYTEIQPPDPGSAVARAQEEGRDGLARTIRADASAARWLAADILARRSAPLEQRVAAANALRGLHLQPTRLALFAGGVDPQLALRAAALSALCGWSDPAVHRFLLDALQRNDRAPGWIPVRAIRKHFGEVTLRPGSPEEKELGGYLREALVSENWRRAFHALQLAPALHDPAAIPVLIEGLQAWNDRRSSGSGRLRIDGDITRELRRRSGRSIGPFAERWSAWWKARQSPNGSLPPDPAQVTSATFFGLRLVTDRVVFVLDRSGSMDQTFLTGPRTRYEEATEQLLALLTSLGPKARVRVILFSDETRVWGRDGREATASNLALLRTWMEANGPGGGTNLQPAVYEAVHASARGVPDLEALEEDTVVVLCDGETAEGPGWVGPFLEGPNEQAGLVYHCVQIGSEGDGTLEELALETGGDFVLVHG